ncbi:helix-turn-helix domain-containing protein [Paenibacillus sp. WLX2291]|uniref:helix-turn-helix domain-containing protein n=1 Tax=Paenibacillus sp. WLX2291 TaxID=3296934 RepID=UPI00398440DC
MEAIQHTVARNLVKLRKSRNLTLEQTSELTGVSKAMLAQIENQKSNPTVTTLWKIANGLQVSFTTFLKEEEQPIRKLNIKDLNLITDSDDKYLVYPFFAYHPEKKFEVYVVDLLPGCSHPLETEPLKMHPGEEYLIMKEGTITVNLNGAQYEVSEGDALQFSGTIPHGYFNHSDEKASYFMVMYYPEDGSHQL